MGREEHIKWHDTKVSYRVNINKDHEDVFHGLRYRGFIGRSFIVNWNPNWERYSCGVHFFYEKELNFEEVIEKEIP